MSSLIDRTTAGIEDRVQRFQDVVTWLVVTVLSAGGVAVTVVLTRRQASQPVELAN